MPRRHLYSLDSRPGQRTTLSPYMGRIGRPSWQTRNRVRSAVFPPPPPPLPPSPLVNPATLPVCGSTVSTWRSSPALRPHLSNGVLSVSDSGRSRDVVDGQACTSALYLSHPHVSHSGGGPPLGGPSAVQALLLHCRRSTLPTHEKGAQVFPEPLQLEPIPLRLGPSVSVRVRRVKSSTLQLPPDLGFFQKRPTLT